MQIIYFKAECPFPELLPSSPVSLQEVILTRDGEIISSFSDLKLKTLPFYLFHLVPIGFRKIEHQVSGASDSHLQFSSGYLLSSGIRCTDVPTFYFCARDISVKNNTSNKCCFPKSDVR